MLHDAAWLLHIWIMNTSSSNFKEKGYKEWCLKHLKQSLCKRRLGGEIFTTFKDLSKKIVHFIVGTSKPESQLTLSSCWANMSARIIELLNEPIRFSRSVFWTPWWPRLWAPVWSSDEVPDKGGARFGQAKHLLEVHLCIIPQFWSYSSCTSRRWLYLPGVFTGHTGDDHG